MNASFAFALAQSLTALFLVEPDAAVGLGLPPRFLRTLAQSPAGYRSGQVGFNAEVLLGDLLYHSPQVLGARARELGLSCQTCHPNGSTNPTLFIEGLSAAPGSIDLSTGFFVKQAENGRPDEINVPSLRGVRYTRPYGRDGRAESLAEFVDRVIVKEFGGSSLSPSRLRALAAYLQELDFLPNRNLDGTGRLTERASPGQRQGEDLFREPRAGLGGLGCASCHVPSSYFCDGRIHRHATTRGASPYSMDDGIETPTLLNTSETAPYFHDGRFGRLADVVTWYNETFALGLTDAEAALLVEYLEAVGATDLTTDDRSFGQRLLETFAYLQLLIDGDEADSRDVWLMVLEQVAQELVGIEKILPNASSVSESHRQLRELENQCRREIPLSHLRPEVVRLHSALNDYSAVWAGMIAVR